MGHRGCPSDVLGEFGYFAEFRPPFLFGFIRRIIVDVQHRSTANKAKSSQEDFLLVLRQLQSDCLVHSANLHDELLAAFSAELVAAAASNGKDDTGAIPGSQPGRFIVQLSLRACHRLA